jgi:LysM repeat protein
MPAATIGLFALAIVLIAIAFLISQAVDGNGSNQTTEADAFATQNALKTAQAGDQTTQVTQTAQGNETPAGTQTQTTPGATRTTTGTAGGGTYTVKPGDSCSAIATANNTTVEKLMQANNITDPSCPLNAGDTLKLP